MPITPYDKPREDQEGIIKWLERFGSLEVEREGTSWNVGYEMPGVYGSLKLRDQGDELESTLIRFYRENEQVIRSFFDRSQAVEDRRDQELDDAPRAW